MAAEAFVRPKCVIEHECVHRHDHAILGSSLIDSAVRWRIEKQGCPVEELCRGLIKRLRALDSPSPCAIFEYKADASLEDVTCLHAPVDGVKSNHGAVQVVSIPARTAG